MKKLLVALLVLSMIGCSPKEKIDNTPVERGTIADELYLNESIDLKIALPNSMRFATDEEAKMFLQVGEQILDENFEGGEEFVEFYALSTDYTYNVSFIITPRGKMTLDQYMDLQEEQFEQFENDSVKIEVLDRTEIELAGKTWQVLNISTNLVGVTVRQAMAVRMQNDKLLALTFTAGNEEDLDKMVNIIEAAK